jgi:hypothetical protein
MDITKYRRHVVNSSYVGDIHFKNDPWEQVFLFVHDPLLLNDHYLQPLNNHPFVNSGEAYWSNNTTLCLGYRLRNNPDIFRPIFSHKRQHNIDHFQNNIKRVVEKRAEKRAFIELFKIKYLPRVIVEKIIKLAY